VRPVCRSNTSARHAAKHPQMFSTFPAPENALAGAFFLPQFPAKKSHERRN